MYNAQKPAFNVVEPFEGVTIIQLNAAMKRLLIGFIEEVQDVEVELVALQKALTDPIKARELKLEKQEIRRQQEANRRRIRRPETV